MDFNEKLQELRKQKGLTQEELASALFVSRTAVSKWESGRGYPNIESLKAIAKFFGTTVDALLSGDELLTIAEADTRQQEIRLRDLVFGLLDCSLLLLLFLPFFRQSTADGYQAVSLLALTDIGLYLKVAYFIFVAGSVLSGISTLALQGWQNTFWLRCKSKFSLGFTAAGILLLVLTQHPYGAAFLLIYLTIKTFILLKKQ